MNIALAITEYNGQPRVRDLDLAKALEFEDPHKIRNLIKRHKSALEQMGLISATVAENTTGRGRPGATYYMNEEQAVFICTKSNTPKATAITVEVVKAFVAARRGKPDPVSEVIAPSEQSEQVKLRMVTEGRHTFGTRASAELWFKLGLPIVPAMLEEPRQMRLFDYELITGKGVAQ